MWKAVTIQFLHTAGTRERESASTTVQLISFDARVNCQHIHGYRLQEDGVIWWCWGEICRYYIVISFGLFLHT